MLPITSSIIPASVRNSNEEHHYCEVEVTSSLQSHQEAPLNVIIYNQPKDYLYHFKNRYKELKEENPLDACLLLEDRLSIIIEAIKKEPSIAAEFLGDFFLDRLKIRGGDLLLVDHCTRNTPKGTALKKWNDALTCYLKHADKEHPSWKKVLQEYCKLALKGDEIPEINKAVISDLIDPKTEKDLEDIIQLKNLRHPILSVRPIYLKIDSFPNSLYFYRLLKPIMFDLINRYPKESISLGLRICTKFNRFEAQNHTLGITPEFAKTQIENVYTANRDSWATYMEVLTYTFKFILLAGNFHKENGHLERIIPQFDQISLILFKMLKDIEDIKKNKSDKTLFEKEVESILVQLNHMFQFTQSFHLFRTIEKPEHLELSKSLTNIFAKNFESVFNSESGSLNKNKKKNKKNDVKIDLSKYLRDTPGQELVSSLQLNLLYNLRPRHERIPHYLLQVPMLIEEFKGCDVYYKDQIVNSLIDIQVYGAIELKEKVPKRSGLHFKDRKINFSNSGAIIGTLEAAKRDIASPAIDLIKFDFYRSILSVFDDEILETQRTIISKLFNMGDFTPPMFPFFREEFYNYCEKYFKDPFVLLFIAAGQNKICSVESQQLIIRCLEECRSATPARIIEAVPAIAQLTSQITFKKEDSELNKKFIHMMTSSVMNAQSDLGEELEELAKNNLWKAFISTLEMNISSLDSIEDCCEDILNLVELYNKNFERTSEIKFLLCRLLKKIDQVLLNDKKQQFFNSEILVRLISSCVDSYNFAEEIRIFNVSLFPAYYGRLLTSKGYEACMLLSMEKKPKDNDQFYRDEMNEYLTKEYKYNLDLLKNIECIEEMYAEHTAWMSCKEKEFGNPVCLEIFEVKESTHQTIFDKKVTLKNEKIAEMEKNNRESLERFTKACERHKSLFKKPDQAKIEQSFETLQKSARICLNLHKTCQKKILEKYEKSFHQLDRKEIILKNLESAFVKCLEKSDTLLKEEIFQIENKKIALLSNQSMFQEKVKQLFEGKLQSIIMNEQMDDQNEISDFKKEMEKFKQKSTVDLKINEKEEHLKEVESSKKELHSVISHYEKELQTEKRAHVKENKELAKRIRSLTNEIEELKNSQRVPKIEPVEQGLAANRNKGKKELLHSLNKISALLAFSENKDRAEMFLEFRKKLAACKKAEDLNLINLVTLMSHCGMKQEALNGGSHKQFNFQWNNQDVKHTQITLATHTNELHPKVPAQALRCIENVLKFYEELEKENV